MTPSTGGLTDDRVDVAVIGDGPAGSAVARACQRLGIDVVLVGDDSPWTATYSTWADDLIDDDGVELLEVAAVTGTASDEVWAHGARPHRLARVYTTFDNDRLRSTLRLEVPHCRARVERVVPAGSGSASDHRLELDDGSAIAARVVIDATGWPARFARQDAERTPAWQTALGVVLSEPPAGDLGRATLMDFRGVVGADGAPSSVGPGGVTTFCYSLPVRDGWLVEETVLAARPAIEPIALLPRLAARLGRHPDSVLADAVRTEYVRIALGGSRPSPDQPIVAFGAAAGYVHVATGFSVAASIRAAPRVADAIARALDSSAAVDPASIADAVWTASMRRTRVLHDFGLEVLLALDDDEVREFFDTFFELSPEDWAAYLRVDTPPRVVSSVMARLFRSSSWQLRRRLAAGRNPVTLARLLRG